MAMWQRLLERFVPLVDEDLSALDRRDGVGTAATAVGSLRAGAGHDAHPASGGRTAYQRSIRPRTS